MVDKTQILSLLPGTSLLSSAPGRVNLLGEHVDYNGGIVLPIAIDRWVNLAVRARGDNEIHLTALDLQESVDFRIEDLSERVNRQGKPLPRWVLYPAGVAWALISKGFKVCGMEGVFSSTVPIGAGLSSSAAVEMAFAVAWQALGGWQTDRMNLARICQLAENQYVGVNCGLMDQFSSAHGVAHHALWFDTRSLEWRPLPLPPKTAVVVADSGVRRELAVSAYNDRRAACEKAVELLKEGLPNIQSLRDVSPTELEENKNLLPEEVYKRAKHVVGEIERVNLAADYLMQDDAVRFGKLMQAGHHSLRDLYEVSCPELDALVEIASSLPGCYGARLTGAGFGGCTVNLVQADSADAFIDSLGKVYFLKKGRKTEIYKCQASRGAFVEMLP